MKITILVTGGTFDKEYNEVTGKLFFKDTHASEMLDLARSRLPIEIQTLMMIDSIEMADKDREKIVEHIKALKTDKVLITHGTDTMVATSQYIAKRLKNKTVVITGAIIPYKFGSSDGLFNLGSALAFVQTLPHGVYIAMNGRCFHHYNCVKNRKTGEFLELDKA